MNRVTVVYILVLLACATGVSTILEFGASLTPPADLTGVWDVGVDESADKNAIGEKVDVKQSGRFVRLKFDGGLRMDLKLVSEESVITPEQTLHMNFQGDGWKMIAEGASAEGPLVFRLTGPDEHQLTVTRHVAAELAEAAPSLRTQTADAAAHAP